MNSQNLAEEHYSRADVQKEIADFCAGRWVAAHCINEKGELIFRRYFKGKPLAIRGENDVPKILKKLGFQVRTLYATANKYCSINQAEDVSTFSNIVRCTPTWDIDGTLSNWRETIIVAKEVVKFLENEGVKNSVYVKWSGNGCHIHIHEEALSEAALNRAHPLDLAYAIVEYVNINVLPNISENLNLGNVRVENRMDAGRVFTCPLSLHRQLDVVCICMKLNELDGFSLKWIQPDSFRHNVKWREFTRGEADKLALKAYETAGGYLTSIKAGKREKTKGLDQLINEWLQKT